MEKKELLKYFSQEEIEIIHEMEQSPCVGCDHQPCYYFGSRCYLEKINKEGVIDAFIPSKWNEDSDLRSRYFRLIKKLGVTRLTYLV